MARRAARTLRKTLRKSMSLEEREKALTQRLKNIQLQKQIRDLRDQMRGKTKKD